MSCLRSRCVRDERVLRFVVELLLSPALRDQALWAHDHHDHEQEAVDRERDLRGVEIEPELARDRVEHVRDQIEVDRRQGDRAEYHAPDGAEAAEDHHAEDQDQEVELELARVARFVERPEDPADMAAKPGARAVASSFVLTAGTPMATAATSSS